MIDPRLLSYYNRELQHVREMGGEFAHAYPKIAGRLGLEGFECADPYVERLLEGFAFLAARVQLKLDAQYPVFTQHLLEMLYPHYLAPIPSMAVVQLQPDAGEAALASGHRVPRQSVLRSQLAPGERTACEFRTAHDVTLWPLALREARYLDTPAALAAAGIELPGGRAVRAGIRLRMETLAGVHVAMLALDALPIFLAGADEQPRRLYESILGRNAGFVVRAVGANGPVSLYRPPSAVAGTGFEDAESLIPYGDRSFSGYRLLQEYFALPQRFLFANFDGLQPLLRRAEGSTFEIVVLLEQGNPALHNAISVENFRLFCTPAINLFPHRGDRIHLEPGCSEYHVVPDRTRPLDLEVHSLQAVDGYGDRQEPEQRFEPFYGGGLQRWHSQQRAYFTTRREPRLLTTRQRRDGARSSYIGNEMFISLVDDTDKPLPTSLRQLGMQMLCTNRDLPLQMPVGKGKTDFNLEGVAPVQSVRCVAGPSRPRTAQGGDETAWRLLSHLQLNYLSLLDDDAGAGASALREMLTLYCDPFDASAQRLVEGIKSVASRPIVRRIPVPGPITFGRGLEITLTCEDAALEGTGAYLLGTVMQRFFARYVSVNSFTETVLRTLERNEVARWKARPGLRQTL